MTFSPEFLAWLDRRLKDFSGNLVLSGREERYRRVVPHYDGWIRSIPEGRRNVLCGSACAAFAAELMRFPRAWVFLAGLQVATVHMPPIETETAWREYDFSFSPSVVGDPVAWKQHAFQPRWLGSNTHALLAHRDLVVCPTTGFIILAGLRQVLEEPSNVRRLYEGGMRSHEWVLESVQWAVTPSIGFTLLPAAYRGARIIRKRPAVLQALLSQLRRVPHETSGV